MASTKSRMGARRKKFEYLSRETVSVPCPWSKKGTVMRQLIIESESKKRQLIDGVRIFEDHGWVLVAPDRLTASFNIFAESKSKDEAVRLIQQYKELVEEYQLH